MKSVYSAAIAASVLSCAVAHGAIIPVEGNAADAGIGINSASTRIIINPTATTIILTDDNFTTAGRADQSAVLVFALPNLSGGTITSADFQSVINQSTFNIDANLDLYGIGTRATATVLTSDYAFGTTGNVGDVLIQNDYAVDNNGANNTNIVYNTDATADTTLAAYLTGLYTGGAMPGEFVFLRLQGDARSRNAYTLTSANNTTTTDRPLLTITTLDVPEPATAGLLGLVALTAMRRRH